MREKRHLLEAFSQVFITGWHDGHLCACIACHQFPLTDCMQVWLYTKPCCICQTTGSTMCTPWPWWKTIFLCLSACRLWTLCSSVAFCLCLYMHSSKSACKVSFNLLLCIPHINQTCELLSPCSTLYLGVPTYDLPAGPQ